MCDDEACGRGLPTWYAYARALDRLGDETEKLVKAFNDKLDGK